MSTAAATTEKAPRKRGQGRPSKLTPEVHKALVAAVRKGAPLSLACDYVDISHETVMEWLRRGNGTDDRSHTEPYASFARDVAKATPSLNMHALRTVNTVVKGKKCPTCQGTSLDKNEPCRPCRGTGWAVRPDGRLAMTVLERRVSEFAPKGQVSHQHAHSHQVSGSVAITVEHTATSAASALVALGAGQVAAMMMGPLPAIEAEIVEAEVVDVAETAPDGETPA